MDSETNGHLKTLKEEGFEGLFIQDDGPGTFYPEHRHERETAHVVLSGEMELLMDGEKKVVCSGERLDVPAGAVHSAKIGPKGCKYIVGEHA